MRGWLECERTTPGEQIEGEGRNKVDMGQTQQKLSKEKARAESVSRRREDRRRRVRIVHL